MAISAGKSSSTGEFKRYVGVAACYIKALNPTAKEMAELYGRDIDKEPEYLTEKDGVKNLRLTFVVQPDPNIYGEVGKFSHTYFIKREPAYNATKTKVQVIDKYGRTAWATIEEAKSHTIPTFATGAKANIDKDYRPCYIGEAELTSFIINYLNIPSVTKYNRDTREWYMVENPSDSECRFDHIEDWFKGDLSELKAALCLQPLNQVKILFTVRTDEENKQYQGSYTRMTLRNGVTKYDKLDEDVQKFRGSSTSAVVASTIYRVVPFQEYTVEATTFTENTQEDELPFNI